MMQIEAEPSEADSEASCYQKARLVQGQQRTTLLLHDSVCESVSL